MSPGRGRGLLVGTNVLAGCAVTLAIPTILGRCLDAILDGDGYLRWLFVAAGLIVLGIVTSIIDAFVGPAGADRSGPISATAVAAIALPVGSLVLLALIDPRLCATLIGGVLLSAILAAVGATARGPGLHNDGVVTWRILGGTRVSIAGPLVLVTVVGVLQLLNDQISAGELLAAAQYAVLGAGLANLTAYFGRSRQ